MRVRPAGWPGPPAGVVTRSAGTGDRHQVLQKLEAAVPDAGHLA
jgi:hypothetical protein